MNINCTPLFSLSGNGVVEHRKYFTYQPYSFLYEIEKKKVMFVIYSVINKIEIGGNIMCDDYDDERLVYIFYFEHYILKKF